MDKGVDHCGQESGDLWIKEWRLLDKGRETCGQESGDLRIRDLRLVDMIVT